MKQIDLVHNCTENGPRNPRQWSRITPCLPLLTMLIMLMVGVGNVWGKTWTWKVTVGVASGSGTATAEVIKCPLIGSESSEKSCSSTSTTTSSTSASENHALATSNTNRKYKFSATPSNGYSFGGWYTSTNVSGTASSTSNPLTGSKTNSGFDETRYAKFVPVTVSSAGSASAISFNHPETKTSMLTFPVSNNADSKDDFNAPTVTANSGWTVSSWSFDNTNNNKKVTVTLSFTANSNTSKGNHQATVTLKAKSNEQNTGTVTASVDLTPTLTFDNGTCDISVSDNDKTTLNVAALLTAYKGADDVAGDGTITYSLKTANSNVSLTSAGVFYAKALGTYTIVASAAKGRYYAKTAEFTVSVGKRTPTVVFAEPEHIYSGNTLSNMAKVQYNGVDVPLNQVDFDYSFENPSWFSLNPSNDKQIMVSTDYNTVQTAKLYVTTEETSHYKSVTADKTYTLEVKRTPEFYLNAVLLDKNETTNLYLEVDETAQFTFDKITTGFEYPTQPSHFTYNNATGVLTATVAGDETFFFNEPGDAVTFQHQCNLHLYVSKHATELTTLINDNDVWMVDDTVAESSIYELANGDANVEVYVSSNNTDVIAKEDGKWVAKGKGSAVLTIAQATSDKWTGDTITRTIYVNKYDPEFTWNLPATVNYNMAFAHPVSSTNEMEDCTFNYSSNNASVINWTNGALRTFEKAGTNVGITVTQAGNYKWNSKTQTFYVDVAKLPDHVEINMNTQAVRDAVYSGKANKGSISCSTSGKITLDQNSLKVWTANPLYYDIHFTGVPKNVTFTYSQSMASSTAIGATGKSFIVYESANGTNWTEVWTSDGALGNTSTHSKTQTLDPSTQYLRFFFDGTYAGYYENIIVRERTEILAGATSLNFGSADAGSDPSSQSVNISWYNVNPLTLSIEGGDGKYSVSPSSIASSKDHYAVGVPVTVYYKHDAGGTHNANLVISDGVVSKSIALTGTTNKVTPEITWKENLSPMSRGENVTDPAEAIVELVYTSSDSTVVDVEGNVLKPLKKGNATITALYDGTESLVYNSNSSTIDVLVTNLAVQHINWTQGFTRLKWSDDAVLSEKNTADFPLDATVSYYDPETEQEVDIIDRAITYTSGNTAVVEVLEGNVLHVVGQGNTTLTAHIDGIADSLYEATVVRDVIVREPTLDCEMWVLEDKSASMSTEINSYTGVEEVYDLSGEPGYLSFEAWREAIHIVVDWTGGNLFAAEKIGNEWHELTGEDGLELDLNYENRKAFDAIPMSREATQVKIYKKTGSTGIHAFSGAYVTLARYLELENTKNKKSHAIHLTTTEAKPGVAVEKTFTVNYSNITDQLDVELKHGDKFSIVSAATIGNECGDKGTATVRVRFLSNDVDLYRDTLLVHNLTDTVVVYLSADVDKHHQQITWEPETLNLKTTDNVTFDAVTSAAAAGRVISYAVTAGSEVASVDAATGLLTIIKDGDVTIEASCEGNAKYYDADPVSYTFHIEKVTPTIIKAPKASDVTLPATLSASTWTENGEASVGGTFAWTNPTQALVVGDVAYEVTFTPENSDWYNTATCMVTPHVSKASQTISWSFDATEMYGNADYTFDATASSGLQVTYSSSNNEIASVNNLNKLVLHKAGESVTITATQAGDDTYLPVSESRTFTVLRWTPDIVELPVGGTMYVGRILSDASLTGGSAEVNGQPIQGSFNWEDANSATINEPGPTTHNVIFVPQNANFYNEVNCGPVALTVLRYVPVIASNTLTADGIEFPLTLEHSHIHGSVTMMDYVHVPNVEVTGQVMWKEPTTVLRPGLRTATALFVPDNSDWYEVKEISLLQVQVTGGYVFTGDNDSTWTEEANWAGNLIPTGIDDPVLINENVEIKTEVTVGSLTIKEGVDVVVKDGGVLRIGNHNSESRTTYGNVHIENGGKMILGTGTLQVNNFTLDAKLGTIGTSAASGQMSGDKLNINGDAYFQLALDPEGAITYGWYDFVVPFEVDIVGGIYLPTNLATPLKNGYDFAVMTYDEAKRAVNGKDWNKYSGTMEPGRVYTITVDYRHGWNELVFKKKKGASLTGDRSFTTSYSGLGADVDNGWNGFGNGSLFHTELDVPAGTVVQIYDHANKCYKPQEAHNYSIAVGTSFFMQVDEVKTITLDTAKNNDRFMAPARYRSAIEKFSMSLVPADEDKAVDHLWVGANEEASEAYVIGEDVLKMGTLTEANVARMWTTKGGHNLCAVNAAMSNDQASTPLSLFAPKAGQYTLTIDEAPEDASLYLTYKNNIVWNLSMSPFTFDLTQGTTEGFGLRLVADAPKVTTDIETVSGERLEISGCRKVLIDNVIYIVTPEGKMYDIVGKSVKY